MAANAHRRPLINYYSYYILTLNEDSHLCRHLSTMAYLLISRHLVGCDKVNNHFVEHYDLIF